VRAAIVADVLQEDRPEPRIGEDAIIEFVDETRDLILRRARVERGAPRQLGAATSSSSQ
jgi:hypothetical protein